MSTVSLYDEKNIDALSFPDTEEGKNSRVYIKSMIKHGVNYYVDNIKTRMMALSIDDVVLPITINDEQYENSYVCSPYGHYILYGLEHASTMSNQFLKLSLTLLLKTMGKVFLSGKINKVVIVNNWLFSTDLYPNLSEDQIKSIVEYLKNLFPQHAILFRSIHKYKGNPIYDALKKNKCKFIASRQIFFIHPQDEAPFVSRAFKSDLKLYRESNYDNENELALHNGDSERIKDLYADIYHGKHSDLNPQFNHNFVNLMINSHFPNLIVLRKDGHIDAVAGFICREGVMVCPFLGYDSKITKLYRLTCTALTLEAKKRGLIFNLSAGAAFYKTIRKAEGVMECFAVYDKHLSFLRRFPWNILRGIANTIGVPIIRNYDK